MRWTRGHVLATASAVVVLAGSAVAGVLLSSGTPTPPKAQPRPTVTTPTPEPVVQHQLLSPFTGEPVKSLRQVLAVKIDNIVYARPQTGINSADIVYVLPVEGGLTRFMAIFSSHVPPVIGPVRSARQDDLPLLDQFGRPGFAFSGAQGQLLPHVEHGHIVNLYAGVVGGYFRNNSRPAPYNLYADSKTLLAESRRASKAHNIGFTFGPAPAGGQRVTSETVRYPAATYTFRWSPARQRWLVWIDGQRAMTTGGRQMDPATVVIQHITVNRSPYLEYGVAPPYASTIGGGVVVVLRNGRAYTGRWWRSGWYHYTHFITAGGKPLNFTPGPVWVMLTARNRASYHNESQ